MHIQDGKQRRKRKKRLWGQKKEKVKRWDKKKVGASSKASINEWGSILRSVVTIGAPQGGIYFKLGPWFDSCVEQPWAFNTHIPEERTVSCKLFIVVILKFTSQVKGL